MFCAAVPATAAVGARLNAGQLHKPDEQRRPIPKITGLTIALLLAASILYHTITWQN